MTQAILSLQGISLSLGGAEILHSLSLEVHRGEFLTLLGPSGCGKTTTLRIVAGLQLPDTGRVLLDGQDVTALPPEKRQVNTVFQNYALFPHMNVASNIGYGLKLRGVSAEQRSLRTREMLELVRLEGYEKRMPSQLSGGQRQRVAIARALVNDPILLLLDEPLGALDLKLRRQMQVELKALQEKLGMTFIYVTHDQEEALNMSNRIAVMNLGRFEQIGSPEVIYERPRNRFVAEFIGEANILSGTVVDGSASAPAGCSAMTLGDGLVMVQGDYPPGAKLTLAVRGERIGFGNESRHGFALSGRIVKHSYVGGILRTSIALSTEQTLQLTGSAPIFDRQEDSVVQVYWDPAAAAVIHREEAVL